MTAEVIAYLDSSVLLRVVLRQPEPLAEWATLDAAVSSRLLRVECLRAVDRVRIHSRVEDAAFAVVRSELLDALDRIDAIDLDEGVLDRAAERFETSLGTLDAIHLASALAARTRVPELVFATHDRALAIGAKAEGFPIVGVAI